MHTLTQTSKHSPSSRYVFRLRSGSDPQLVGEARGTFRYENSVRTQTKLNHIHQLVAHSSASGFRKATESSPSLPVLVLTLSGTRPPASPCACAVISLAPSIAFVLLDTTSPASPCTCRTVAAAACVTAVDAPARPVGSTSRSATILRGGSTVEKARGPSARRSDSSIGSS
jgi:hypothetical protein